MAEKHVEKTYREKVEGDGGVAYKFTSPGRRGVPDRLALRPIPSQHRMIVAQYVRFAELKQPGKKPEPWQKREISRLRSMGYLVEVVDEV